MFWLCQLPNQWIPINGYTNILVMSAPKPMDTQISCLCQLPNQLIHKYLVYVSYQTNRYTNILVMLTAKPIVTHHAFKFQGEWRFDKEHTK